MKTNFDEQLFQLGLTILHITVAVGNCSRHRRRGSRTVIFFGLQCSAIGQLVAAMVLPAVVKPGWVYMLTYGTTQHISPWLGGGYDPCRKWSDFSWLGLETARSVAPAIRVDIRWTCNVK